MKSVSILHIFPFLFCLASGTHAQEIWDWQWAPYNITFLSCVQFVDVNTGWIAVGDVYQRVLKTTNAGSSWVAETTGVTNTYMASLHFVNADTGWAVGGSALNSTVNKTTNGGRAWQSQASGGTSTGSVFFVNSRYGWVYGTGTSRKTTDGGNSWTTFFTSPIYSIFFLTPDTGWWVNNGTYGGYVDKTTDGGAHYNSAHVTNPTYLNSVYFTNANTGWVVGDYGAILKTTDGGNTWGSKTSGTNASLKSVCFPDSSHGWAVGDSGVILKTTDGGNTWFVSSQVRDVTSASFLSVSFVDANHGWAVANNGTIWKYTNTTGILNTTISCPVFQLNRGQLRYQLPNTSRVSALLFDERGRLTLKLFDAMQAAGSYSLPLPAARVPGISILDFKADGLHQAVRVR